MSRYILKRLLMMIFVILGVIILIFTLLYFTPGDPARQVLGPNADEEAVQALHTKMGLDDPFLVRLGRYMYNLFFKFDMGDSYRTKTPVMQEIMQRFPITIKIGLWGVFISLVIGISTGIVSAVKQYTLLDEVGNFIAVIGSAMPQFWFGLELSLLFALRWKILPATGYQGFKYLILPVTTMGFTGAAGFFRITRSSMLEVIRSDYVRTARSKGQSEFKVIMHHAFKNALIPIITTISSTIGHVLAGSVLIENIFAIPGLGSYMLTAINNRDYPVIQGGVIFIALFISIVMLITDLIFAMIDPRIKARFKRS